MQDEALPAPRASRSSRRQSGAALGLVGHVNRIVQHQRFFRHFAADSEPIRDPRVLWHHTLRLIRKRKIEDHEKLNEPNSVTKLCVHWLFVVMLFQVITHTIDVTNLSQTTTGLNDFLEHGVVFETLDGSNTDSLYSVSTIDNAVSWSENLVSTLLSDESYRGKRMPDEHLMFLRVHRLINSIVFVQRRVEKTDCSYQAMRPFYRDCYEGLADHEIFTGTQTLTNGLEVHYHKNLGGFAVELPLDREAALEKISELKEGRFWDRATRRFGVLFAMHNSPGHYTGNIEVMFDISEFGFVKPTVEELFLRLKPYSEVVGGPFFLGLQLWAFCFWLMLGGDLVHKLYIQPHTRWVLAKILSPWTAMELLSHMCVLISLVLWICYIWDPRRLTVDFESDEFQDILPLSWVFHKFVFFMTVSMLIWTVRVIEFFAAMPSPKAQKTAKIIEAIMIASGPFLFLLTLVFVGFVFTAHIFFGPVNPRFGDEWRTTGTLLLWFMTLSSEQREMYDVPGGPFFLFFFIMFGMIILLNMFMALVLQAHDTVLTEEEEERNEDDEESNGKGQKVWKDRRPMNHYAADMICDYFGIRKFKRDPYHMEPLKKWSYDALRDKMTPPVSAKR